MVGDDGELHKINLCCDCYNLRQGERKEPAVNGRQWALPVAESRGKLATGLGAHGFEHKIREFYAAKQIYAKIMWKEAVAAVSPNKEWPDVSPCKNKN